MESKRKRSSSHDEASPPKIQRKSKKLEAEKSEKTSKLTKTKTPKSGLKIKGNAKLKSSKLGKLQKSVVKNSSKKGDSLEKPNWTELRKEKKELRKKRKEQKCPLFDVTCKTKKLWEKMRRTDCKPDEREKISCEIHKLMKGNLQRIVFSHDVSRVIQWLLKVGPTEVKQTL
ncbi:hypothetical protein L9F63_000275 [Diploptera punctata]|uniref:Uncharacterized protein n=1 Tax=Diploptera punctata TaxID=6984 RepID=A0AAD8ANJ5_DIPPU|nr:hypothetical protein L9F63_000275 [Diploptera punctata]